MKKALNWALNGTYLWHTLLAFATFGFGLNNESLFFMKIIGGFFGTLAIASIIYSVVIALKLKKKK